MATYTSSFNNPYPKGWKDAPSDDTPINASALQAHTDALQAIDNYLSENPIPEGGGGTGGTTNYNELDNLPSINGTTLKGDIIIDIPAKTSDLENDSGFLTEVPEQSYKVLPDKPSIEGVELNGNVTLDDLSTKKQIRISWADYKALPAEEKNDLSVVYFVPDYPENTITASNVVYDNATSGLESTETQGAIDELNEKVNTKAEQSTVDALSEEVTEGELKTAHGTNIHVIDAKDAPCLVNPYGNTTQNGTPTPTTPIALESTVISEIKTCGSQLFNAKALGVGSNTSLDVSNDGYEIIAKGKDAFAISKTDIDINLVRGRKIYFFADSITTIEESHSVQFTYTLSGKTTYHSLSKNTLSAVLNIPNDITAADIRVVTNNSSTAITTDNTVTIKGLRVNLANEPYEPYTETVVTLPEPITLNSLGDVKDYIDMKRGVLVQKFKKFVANSSSVNSVTNNVVYIHATPMAKVNTKALCTHDENVNASATGYTLYFKDEVNATSAEAYKAFLDGNEVEFMYELAEPIITPLSEANIKALRELKSFDGVTNVFNNANAEMDFMYASTDNAAINMENNNKFNDFITIVKGKTTLNNTSPGNFQTMLSNIIPDGYKLVGITNIYVEDTNNEIAGQVRVQANVQSVDYADNIVMLNCGIYTGTSNPITGTITFEFIMMKK